MTGSSIKIIRTRVWLCYSAEYIQIDIFIAWTDESIFIINLIHSQEADIGCGFELFETDCFILFDWTYIHNIITLRNKAKEESMVRVGEKTWKD